jgi:ComEC/Rec2-related protein
MQKWILYNLGKNPAVIIVIGFIFGIVYFFDLDPFVWILFPLFLLFLYSPKIVLILSLGFLVGYSFASFFYQNNIAGREKYYEQNVEFEGVVESSSINGIKNRLDLLTSEYGRVRIYVDSLSTFRLGDTLYVEGKLSEPKDSDEFKFKQYLQTLNIHYVLYRPAIEVMQDRGSFYTNFLQILGDIREGFSSYFRDKFDEPHASLIIGMTLGIETEYSDGFDRSVKVTGTSHIVAVSGFNVMLVINFVLLATKKFNRNLGLWISIIFILIFWVLVGVGNQPATRAVLMNLVYLGLFFMGRNLNRMVVLAYVVCLMHLMNPLMYKSLSFLLSLSAMAGIWTLSDILSKKVQFIPQIFRNEFASTLSATIGTIPITTYYFKTLSLISVFVNMLILPTIPFVTITSFVEFTLSGGPRILVDFVHKLNTMVMNIIVGVIEVCGTLDQFYFEDLPTDKYFYISLTLFQVWFFAKLFFDKFKLKLSSNLKKCYIS